MKSSLRSYFVFLFATLFIHGVSFATAASEAASSAAPPPVEVVVETNLGSFELELYPDKAPKTVANYLAYVDDGFYDKTIFHRVIPGFVIQGGGFGTGMKYREPREPVINESDNRLKNLAGTISMARRTHPDTATSQFYINLSHNNSLDYISSVQPGYTVFGSISKGMDIINQIAMVETTTVGRSKDVPKEDVVLLSVRRKDSAAGTAVQKGDATLQALEPYVAGEHYVVLDRPVPTRDNSKVEVVEMFAYGCPHCYEFEPLIKDWGRQQSSDVDFWYFPAVWNKPMKLYARAFYAARELNVEEIIHHPLFTAIVIEQRKISNEVELEEFFERYGVKKEAFNEAFHSPAVEEQVRYAEQRVQLYKPAGAPEIIVNGRYRVDRMRAGGLTGMLAVVDYLVNKERARLN